MIQLQDVVGPEGNGQRLETSGNELLISPTADQQPLDDVLRNVQIEAGQHLGRVDVRWQITYHAQHVRKRNAVLDPHVVERLSARSEA